jgi:hypothetical protein
LKSGRGANDRERTENDVDPARPSRPKKNAGPEGPAQYCRRVTADNHLPEGNSWLQTACHLGGNANGLPTAVTNYAGSFGMAQRNKSHASHAMTASRCAM